MDDEDVAFYVISIVARRVDDLGTEASVSLLMILGGVIGCQDRV